MVKPLTTKAKPKIITTKPFVTMVKPKILKTKPKLTKAKAKIIITRALIIKGKHKITKNIHKYLTKPHFIIKAIASLLLLTVICNYKRTLLHLLYYNLYATIKQWYLICKICLFS